GAGRVVGSRAGAVRKAPVSSPLSLPFSRSRLSLLLTPSASSTLKFQRARWMMAAMLTLILSGLLRGARTQHALVLENLALRHQLAVLQRTAPRPRLRPSDRVFW